MNYQEATLDNGLRICAEILPDAHSSAIGFFVKTGARDETSALMGTSHFLEHMMFKGSAKRTAADVDRDFDDIGSNHNAFTSAEMTAFYAHCLPEYLSSATEILADILRPALRQDDFDTEKSVILEEIAMYNDQPFWVLYERAMAAYYGDHPLSHRVLGTNETITDLSRDQMQQYFEDRYSADNTVVAAAGAIDFERLVTDVASACGSWIRTDAQRRYDSRTTTPDKLDIRLSSVVQSYLLMMMPAPALNDDRRYAASMLSSVLGDDEGSRLYWALVETGLAEEAVAQYQGRDQCGDLLVYASCEPARREEVEALIQAEMDRVVDSVTEDDLERVRNKVRTAATLHSEMPAGRMNRLGRLWMYFDAYYPLEDDLARMDAVTLKDLRDVAAAFPLSPVVKAHLGPEE